MTYSITFYCQVGVDGPEDVLAKLLSTMEKDGLRVLTSGLTSGLGWVAADLHLESESVERRNINLEVRNDAELVRTMVRQVEGEDFSGEIKRADAILTMTLAGDDINWDIVRGVWLAIEEQWFTVPYDDVSGFGTSVEMLG